MQLAASVDRVIGEMPGVSLEALDERAALQRRIDSKYVLDAEAFAELLSRLSADHEVLEIEGRRMFAYQSVYFDTPELRCFRDHVEDRAPRFKVRTRLYRDTGKCVFEVKLKPAEGETDKRHIPYRANAADRIDDEASECLARALADAELEPPEQPLEATLRTSFGRITLSPTTGSERTTCDLGIELERPGGQRTRLKQGLVVVETKSENGDSPTDRALAELHVEPMSFSKYRTGIAVLTDARDPDSPRGGERFFEARSG